MASVNSYAYVEVKVLDLKGQTTHTWGKEITDLPFERLYQDLEGQKSQVVESVFQRCIIPTRTDKLRSFAEDLLVPTLSSHLKTSSPDRGGAGDWMLRFLTTALDLFTLPARLVTCIPRIFYNACQQENSLHKDLRGLGCDDKEILNADVVIVTVVKANEESQSEEFRFCHPNTLRLKVTSKFSQAHFKAVPKVGILSKGAPSSGLKSDEPIIQVDKTKVSNIHLVQSDVINDFFKEKFGFK